MEKYEENMKKHNMNLSRYACLDEYAIRFKTLVEDIRPPFFRDADKILYTLSYSRYKDKTQVFSFNEDDMITKRMTHIQLVSKIARTIGRGLGLNEDLIEAASLGHDLGHVPFGHAGEKILNDISLKNNEGYFNHNVQSVRILMNIENGGEGSNVTLQVLDAILCHNGEVLQKEYIYHSKTKEQFLNEYNSSYKDFNTLKNIRPMTLEGCVVKISDVIAYIGKDIEDAIRLNKIVREDIPKDIVNTLGNTNSKIINTIINDILKNSINKNKIVMSDNIYNSLNSLICFNYDNIYNNALTINELDEIRLMFDTLFEYYLEKLESGMKDSNIYTVFLNDMSKDYIENTTNSRKVIDFISGMTDNYFLSQYKSICKEKN
ncbi:MAG: HD domain-containing protein [bacterium]|nr:HD domain-containing protein [bacterium]